ncbi:hypothetical protein [Mesorhizobium sp. LNHC252B00]|uniref:hypothetical protein n=1 Tax=Mesorhizobium sp. LNHC252B00 TaxID=1287252 RepID=UPI0004159363|nr:hypothetical protein [Mesorhizobium sp. LNHC252B00]
MAITTYSFFGKVAEIVGRLTALQEDCASAEVHRRMAEIYGEREGTRRMTNMVLQSQASCGTLERTMNGKRLARVPKTKVSEPKLIAWLVEACIRYSERPISVATLASNPIMFPFEMNGMVLYALSTSSAVGVRATGGRDEVAHLRNDV